MHIKRLRIRGYRCLDAFEWHPQPGMNCLVGPGDSGKSTVLSAISLLLAPYHIGSASEFDYHKRNLATGFEIEACLGGLDLRALSVNGPPPLRGWKDGALVPLPDEEGAEPVILCRVRGTPDLEVVHEMPVEGEQGMSFSVPLRKKLFLTRLAGEDRAARDLRLSNGSLLDQHLDSPDLRVTIYRTIAEASESIELPEAVTAALERISTRFQAKGLPDNLHLGLMPSQGASLTGMLALLTGANAAEAVPLAYSGTGTRQMALISLSTAFVGASPIIVVDEPERGLEPYRQRALAKDVAELVAAQGQAFLTTHSPAVLQEMPVGAVWRIRNGQPPLQFTARAMVRLLKSDPEAFFARLPIICEGPTEMGLLGRLLPRLLQTTPESLGMRLVNGGGQPNALDLMESFLEAGIPCAGFVDSEPNLTGRRDALRPRCIFFSWDEVCDIEEALSRWLSLEQLCGLVRVAADSTGIGERYLVTQLRDSARRTDITPATAEEIAMSVGEPAFRALMADVDWFKDTNGGDKIADYLIEIGIPAGIETRITTFARRLSPAPTPVAPVA